MDSVRLGKSGDRIPAIGMGKWRFGKDVRAAIAALRLGFDSGVGFVDTAEMYGTEPLVGMALKGRRDVFVATKVLPTHLRYDRVIRACEASLSRLGISTIDLYQVHFPNPHVPMAETMRAMEALVKAGKIRHIGVSNFSVGQMEEAQASLKGEEIVSNQVEYSIIARDAERELLGHCKRENLALIAYSPLAHGALYDAKHAALLRLLTEVGRPRGKSATQVALNWLMSKGPAVPIPKATAPRHVAEIAGSAGWRIGATESRRIDRFLSRNCPSQGGLAGIGLVERFPALASIEAWWDHLSTGRP